LLGSLQIVQAGWLDEVKSVSKQLVDEATKSTRNNPKASQKQPAREPARRHYQQAKYDSALVADIQRELNRAGYGVGAVDGAYGLGTSRAIQRFQRDQRMAVDGVPNGLLLQRLRTQSGRQAKSASNGVSSTPQQRAGTVTSHQPSLASSPSSSPSTVKEDVSANSASDVTMLDIDNITLPDIDVVGVRLDMAVEEATRILESNGYDSHGTGSYASLAYRARVGLKVLPETKGVVNRTFYNQDKSNPDTIGLPESAHFV